MGRRVVRLSRRSGVFPGSGESTGSCRSRPGRAGGPRPQSTAVTRRGRLAPVGPRSVVPPTAGRPPRHRAARRGVSAGSEGGRGSVAEAAAEAPRRYRLHLLPLLWTRDRRVRPSSPRFSPPLFYKREFFTLRHRYTSTLHLTLCTR